MQLSSLACSDSDWGNKMCLVQSPLIRCLLSVCIADLDGTISHCLSLQSICQNISDLLEAGLLLCVPEECGFDAVCDMPPVDSAYLTDYSVVDTGLLPTSGITAKFPSMLSETQSKPTRLV